MICPLLTPGHFNVLHPVRMTAFLARGQAADAQPQALWLIRRFHHGA
jgi:hypothetical protein